MILLLILLFPFGSLLGQETPGKKKILVLSSNGGYGHNAATNTLKSLLGNKYDFTVFYPIDELRIWGVRSGEEIYNTMLRWGWIGPMNLISKHVAPKIFRARKRQVEEIIAREIVRAKPDLVISLIPYVNLPASEAARKRDIPFLLITTDNDLRHWVHGLHAVTHPRFKVTIGDDLPTTRDVLRQRHIPDSAIETIGLPLRPDFFSPKKNPKLCKQYDIPEGKPVILIMMGGSGGEASMEYTQEIGQMDLGAHIIVCCGKNKRLVRKIKKIPLKESNTLTAMGFTEKIADLMSMADLIITKPGPGTIEEAMAMHLPVLVDGTRRPLRWEKVNLDLVERYGIGERVDDLEDMELLLKRYLHDPQFQRQVREAFQRLPGNHFHERIPAVIESMFNEEPKKSPRFSRPSLVKNV